MALLPRQCSQRWIYSPDFEHYTPFSPEFSFSSHGSLQEWRQLIVLCCGVFSTHTHTHYASLKQSQAQQTSVQVRKTLKIQSCQWILCLVFCIIYLDLQGDAVLVHDTNTIFHAWTHREKSSD